MRPTHPRPVAPVAAIAGCLPCRAALVVVTLLATRPAVAQLPLARLTGVFPAGGQQGQAVDVTLTGIDLDGVDRLIFSQPGLTATQKTVDPLPFEQGPQPVANEFTVTIAADVAPGPCEIRALGKYGLSNPRTFVVGAVAEQTEKEPNNTPEQAQPATLESVIHGRADSPTDLDMYRITVGAGQRVLIDCWARRIDSRLDPTLVLFDAQGKEVARARDREQRDAVLDFTAPVAGEYRLEVHDFVYGGGPEYFYRLSIGVGPRVDFVFPPAGLAGTQGSYFAYGRNLPGGQPAQGLTIDGHPLEMLPVQIQLPAGDDPGLLAGALVEPAEAGMDLVAWRLMTPAGQANPVLLSLATAPVVVEQEPNNDPAKAQNVALPSEVVGQFYPQADEDWFSFAAKAGDIYWIEVFSRRLGLHTDPFLLVQQVTVSDEGEEQIVDLQGADDVGGNVGGLNFDSTHDDPSYRFVAPADGAYRVLVRDLYHTVRGDPRFVYRLAIRLEQPDFRLVAAPRSPGVNPDPNQNQPLLWNPLLRPGGSDLIDVMAYRRDGFDGEIQVTASGLPEGVTAGTATIGPGQTSASIVLSAAEGAQPGVASIAITGRAQIGEAEVTRTARQACMVWPGLPNQFGARSRLARSLMLAIAAGQTAPYAVQAGQNATFEMSRAGKLEIPVSVVRRGDFKGNLVLAAAGLPPNIQPANLTLDGNTASGALPLTLQANAPVGVYSFYVQATTQLPYSRNPEAAQAAAARKELVDKYAAEQQAAAKAAADAKSAADKLANDAQAEAKRTADAQKAAKKTGEGAQARLKAAIAKQAAAKAALDKDTNNKALAEALTAADKVVADATAESQKATESAAAAEKTAADAALNAAEAKKAQVVAAEAALAAEAKNKAAAQIKAQSDKLATDTANAARPNNINVGFPSTLVTLKITPAPIALSIAAPQAALKQGEKLELPVSIARLYNYADAVQLNLVLPSGVTGLSAPQTPIPAGQNAAPLPLTAAANATPGEHQINVRANLVFNGQNLQVLATVPLRVEAAPAAAK